MYSYRWAKISPVTRQLLPIFDKTKSLRHEKSALKICQSGKSVGFTIRGKQTKAMGNNKFRIDFSPKTRTWHTGCSQAFDNECCSNKRSNAGHGSHR